MHAVPGQCSQWIDLATWFLCVLFAFILDETQRTEESKTAMGERKGESDDVMKKKPNLCNISFHRFARTKSMETLLFFQHALHGVHIFSQA